MSDVISYLGYRGEALVFLDNEKYSFVSGRGLCVNDASGCSDILWRNDGISCYAAHVARGMVAFAAPSALKPIEVMDFQERQTLKSFENPSASEIIDMDFSRSGNKLYAISGVRNPKLIIWDFETEKVVVNLDLKQEHRKVLVNPGDDRMFALYGDKGVQVGLVNEISGIEYVKLETLNLESKKFFTEDSEEDKLRASAEANSITCCVWTPYDYLIIGNRAGKIAEALVVDRKSVAVLRKSILGGSKPEETTVATSAAISNGYCVVGSNVGTVYWFPMVTFGGQPNPDAALMDCRSPMQTTKVSGSVTAVAIDSYSRRVLIGTAHNGILTSQLDIQERHHEGDDMLEVSADDMHNAGPMEVETEHILETQAGAVLGSKAAAITITNSDVVPVFIAGAHDGSFAVWKHPQADSAAQERWDMQGGKVLPEASQLLCSYRVGLGSSPQTICSMDVLPFKSKMGTCLVAFGLSSGWVEVWELAGSMSGKDVAVTGTKLGARRLYESPIVSVAASTFQTGSGPVCALALASAMDPVVYVVETFSTPQNSLTFDVRNTFKVESGGPSALTWHGDSLLVADTKGTLSQFSSSNGVAGTNKLTFPRVETAWSVGDVNVVAATLAKAKVPEVVVLPASSNTFSFFSLGDVTKVTTGPAHESAIVSTAMSGSGTHLACGCVSGALYVWQRDAGDPAGWKLVAQEYVHADAVSSVCFSADSSLVFSCGIDGSYFVYKVKEAVYLKPDTKVMKLSESPPADVEFTTFANMPDTWMSKREAKAVELLRFQNRDNLDVLEKSLEEVREKHRALLAENDARSDLEKMELSEFVVDVQARDGLVEQNAASTSELFTAYRRSNALNELLAARVRAMCVDTMDSTSRPVLPILDKSKSAVVTSLAQRKYVFCSLFFLPFLVCDVSLSLSLDLLLPACILQHHTTRV
jgi:WD40 repeat protein